MTYTAQHRAIEASTAFGFPPKNSADTAKRKYAPAITTKYHSMHSELPLFIR